MTALPRQTWTLCFSVRNDPYSRCFWNVGGTYVVGVAANSGTRADISTIWPQSASDRPTPATRSEDLTIQATSGIRREPITVAAVSRGAVAAAVPLNGAGRGCRLRVLGLVGLGLGEGGGEGGAEEEGGEGEGAEVVHFEWGAVFVLVFGKGLVRCCSYSVVRDVDERMLDGEREGGIWRCLYSLLVLCPWLSCSCFPCLWVIVLLVLFLCGF